MTPPPPPPLYKTYKKTDVFFRDGVPKCWHDISNDLKKRLFFISLINGGGGGHFRL